MTAARWLDGWWVYPRMPCIGSVALGCHMDAAEEGLLQECGLTSRHLLRLGGLDLL